MDNGRFDSLVKSLASGTSRRSVLKGLLGLGGVVSIGARSGPGAEAARRPAPTPRPITCPGSQYWDGETCACTSGEVCGSDCCPSGSECCDGACCVGHCYGEELCCPNDNWCDAAGACCPDGATCCDELGCIVFEEGDCGCAGECPDGFECCGGQCCATGYCAGVVCCALGVCGDICLGHEDQACCDGLIYFPGFQYCCDGHIIEGECCVSGGCAEGSECCGGTCCPSGACAGEVCCEFGACGGECLASDNHRCCAGTPYNRLTRVCCDGQTFFGNCCGEDDCQECARCEGHQCNRGSCP